MGIETLPLTEARGKLPQIVKDVERLGERFIITLHGRAKAVVMSFEEYEGWIETLTITSDKEAMKGIERGMLDLKANKTKTFGEVFGEPLDVNVKISCEAEKTIRKA